MFAIIAGAELVIEFLSVTGVSDPGYNFRDQLLEIGQVSITKSTEAIRDLFRIGEFGAN